MARVSTYLNFESQTEEAFNFYKQVFGTEFEGDGIQRMGDVPAGESDQPMSDEVKNLVMHVDLPILGDHHLMGTDAPESMGFNKMNFGNNIYINLESDTLEETERLFKALSEGGQVESELKKMFWGAYFGAVIDKFGVRWMFNCQVDS